MSKNFTITLTDAEEKALAVVALSPQEWIENVVKERCRIAIGEIVIKEVNRRMNTGESIPSNREELVLSDSVKTAAELQAIVDAQKQAQ